MSTFTQSLRLWQGTPGDPAILNAWGTFLNIDMALIESAMLGTSSISIAGLTTYALTTANGASDQAREYVQTYTGALTANCTVTLPNVPKIGWAQNATTGGFAVVLTTGGSGTNLTIPADGFYHWYMVDGSGNVTSPTFAYGEIEGSSLATTGNATVGGTLGVTGTATGAAGVVSGGYDANGANFRFYSNASGYGAIWRNDNSSAYLLLTANGNPLATWNALRPLTVNVSTGAVSIDGTGVGTTFGGAVTVGGNLGVDGAATIDGVTYFGTSGQFCANPNNSGRQLLNFAANQFIEFIPGTGFSYTTSGTHLFYGTVNATGTLTAGTLQQNGVGVCVNNGGTYSINITGNAGGTSAGCPWGGISGIPALVYNDGRDYGINISGTATYANGCGGNFGVSGYVNVTGATTLGGSAGYWNGSGTISPGPWTVAASVVGGNYIVAGYGFAVQSDGRLKADVSSISTDDGVAWVRAGRPCTYTIDGKMCAGFIAQEELASIRGASIGYLASDDERVAKSDGFCPDGSRLTKDYLHDIPYLTAALQAAFEKIDALEAKLAGLTQG